MLCIVMQSSFLLSFIRVIQICNYIIIQCEISLISPCSRIMLILNYINIYTMIDYVHKSFSHSILKSYCNYNILTGNHDDIQRFNYIVIHDCNHVNPKFFRHLINYPLSHLVLPLVKTLSVIK